MLTSEWIYLIKIGDIITFKDSLEEEDHLKEKYGIITGCSLGDAAQKICDNCNVNGLKDIKEGEIWAYFSKTYFCNECFPKVKQQQKQNLQKKIPHKLKDVVKEIELHSQYDKLDVITKMQYESCRDNLTGKSADNNKYIRASWYHLYHNKHIPIG